MKKYILSFVLLFSISFIAQAGLEVTDPYIDPAGLEDPRNRDEDISHTIVTASWEMLADGNYAYNYSIKTLPENKGEVLTFSIDVSCESPSLEPLGYRLLDNYSDDGKHILIGTDNPNYENIQGAAITAGNQVLWGVHAKPGEFRTGARIISKEAPVERIYTLKPSWDTANWAYELYEDDPALPWIDDFIVTGTILAPRCSTDTSPIPEDPNTPPADGGDNGTGDDTTPTDCKKGKGKATGHDIGLGHEISNGKHLGHEHNCE